VHTKFAEVYAELIKREWPQAWPNMYDDLKKSMRSSCTQFITGVRIFQYFLQDLNSEGADDRLTKGRRSDLKAVLFFS
jgi:singapore isolate B (sub-type 7) whole genome shotgun sequence assembly, scaffold_7